MKNSSRPTIRQVAKLCGVSAMTVSAVLNNKPGQTSEETRERVLKVVRELGYRPTPAKWLPEKRQILTIGVITGVPGDSLTGLTYYGAITNGLLVAADRQGHNITIFANALHSMDPHRSIRVYCDDRCDGLIVIAPTIGNELVKALHERGFPLVLIGDPSDYHDVSSVDVDNIAEGYAITEYLLRQGHRRIAFVGTLDFVRSSLKRREGYLRALAAYGVEQNDAFLLKDTGSTDEVRQLMQGSLEERPTAFFCWHDVIALQTLAVLREMGIAVPEDVSVIGFNDVELDPLIPSFLTTVRQPYAQLSERALEILAEEIQDHSLPTRHIFLPTELMVRGSVAPPRDLQA